MAAESTLELIFGLSLDCRTKIETQILAMCRAAFKKLVSTEKNH